MNNGLLFCSLLLEYTYLCSGATPGITQGSLLVVLRGSMQYCESKLCWLHSKQALDWLYSILRKIENLWASNL